VLGRNVLPGFKAPFDFRRYDPKLRTLELITDEQKILEIGRAISPITHVTPDDPPTLIIHGDKDTLVPLQQAEIMIAKLKEAGVTAELIVRKDAAHGWKNLPKDLTLFADWFDLHLKAPRGK
jgi:dipeptidyl aminopeptidase/acylaminoacyl peptidase